MLETVGLGGGFRFRYRHYGPYSEELATAVRRARIRGLILETENVASWGGMYSTFSTAMSEDAGISPLRHVLAGEMVNADAVELELAATALFLFGEDSPDPWGETERRKPDKAADGRLDRAKQLYRRLHQKTPELLPGL